MCYKAVCHPIQPQRLICQKEPNMLQIPVFFFFFFLAVPCSLQDLGSLTRERTQPPCSGSGLNHWTTREAGKSPFLLIFIFLNICILLKYNWLVFPFFIVFNAKLPPLMFWFRLSWSIPYLVLSLPGLKRRASRGLTTLLGLPTCSDRTFCWGDFGPESPQDFCWWCCWLPQTLLSVD